MPNPFSYWDRLKFYKEGKGVPYLDPKGALGEYARGASIGPGTNPLRALTDLLSTKPAQAQEAEMPDTNAMLQALLQSQAGTGAGIGGRPVETITSQDPNELLRRLLPSRQPGDYRVVPPSQGGVPLSAEDYTPTGGPGPFGGMGPPPRSPRGMTGVPPMGEGGMPEEGVDMPPTIHDFVQQYGREPATDSEMQFYYGDQGEGEGQGSSDEQMLEKVRQGMGEGGRYAKDGMRWERVDEDLAALQANPTPENIQAFAEYWGEDQLPKDLANQGGYETFQEYKDRVR